MNDPPTLISILLKLGPLGWKTIQWVWNRIKWHGISETARKIAFAIHSFSWINLQQTALKINHVGLITRPEIDQILNIWKSSDDSILLYGEAGTGKSGIALHLGHTLVNTGIPVLFIRATDLPNDQEPVSVIQNRIALSIPLMDAIAKLSKERSCSVIIDQLDSISGTELCKNLVSFIKALAGIPNVKILAVSRHYEVLYDTEISTIGFRRIESGRLTPEQSLHYLSILGILKPSQIIKDLASNLLNLSLISDVVELSPFNAEAIISEVELWKRFYISICDREGDEVAEYALKLAREVTAKGERSFCVQFPDRGIRRKLLSRGILIEAPGRRFAFRHEQLQDFLCAYSLLPERPTVSQLLQEFGNAFSKGVISWLCVLYHVECPEEETEFIYIILSARKELPFYIRIGILEALKPQTDPTEIEAKVLSKYSEDWSYNRYFFEGLDNQFWITPLYKTGFFHHTPDPVETQPGYFQLPRWLAGEYLLRYADQYEDIVLDLVQSIRTENWRVQEILIDALIKISPNSAAKLVPQIDPWLDGRFSKMLPKKLESLTNHFLKNGLISASLQVLESVTTPILPINSSEISKYRSELRFRSDHFWVNEFCGNQIHVLMTHNPVGVLSVFERQLEKAIDLLFQVKSGEAEQWVGSYWRMDIPNRFSERGKADVLDVLIDGLRDGLAGICNRSIEEGRKFLKSYLASEHLIFQRVGLYTLRTYGNNYPEMVDQSLLHQDYLEKGEYANEYRGLMRDQFSTASECVREQVISWILAGPVDLETRAKRRAQWNGREANDDDLHRIKDEWVIFHLEIIGDHLSGVALDRLNELTLLYGKPDIEERPHIVTTTWGGAPSPVSSDELVKKTFEELIQLFLTYKPDDLFLNPRESLAKTLQSIVRDDPTRYCDFATQLIDPEIRYIYIYHYLAGIRESLKKGGRLCTSLIDLCEYVVSQKVDPFIKSSGQYEPDLSASQLEVARLLEEALQADDPYLNRDLLNRIRSLLISLAHHEDPKKDDDTSDGFDPFTRSLNFIRGVAMHGIMHYSLYIVLQQEKQGNVKVSTGFIEPEIQSILEERLDKTIEHSIAVHSVYGAFIPQLHFLARSWLEQHLDAIFPAEVEKSNYWTAAWNAFISYTNFYRDVFKLLLPQYQQGLRLLSQPQDEQSLDLRVPEGHSKTTSLIGRVWKRSNAWS